MKSPNIARMRFLFVGVVLFSTLLLPRLLGEQTSEVLNASQESSEAVIMIAGYEYHYKPRPDLGFVVSAQGGSNAMASVYRDLSLFTQAEIKSVGGRDRQRLWIVENRQSAAHNEAAIKTFSAQRQVRYVAPLFSCNGEKEAIIPEIVVRVTAGTEQEELEQICRILNLHIKRKMRYTEQEYLVEVLGENADAVFAALIGLNQIDSVEWAAPNVITQRRRPEAPILENNSQGGVSLFNAPHRTTGFMPNDEYFHMQWHLHNTGQYGGTSDADINAPEAWEITTGDPNIVVAVYDCGVDLDHPDLINNLVPGYDFYENDDLPYPTDAEEDSHGTCCAGIVAAEGNNNIGVVGVAWKCKVMPVRYGTYYIYASMATMAEAIRWAAVNGADIFLLTTLGRNNPTPIIYSAVVDITKPGGIGRDGRGLVVLSPTGNRAMSSLMYPAAYPEVIGVGATDCNDIRWFYSDYGHELDIVAPGGERWYAAPGGKAWPKEGNSIWTTDTSGPIGTNSHPKNPFPDILDYVPFGGTCSACPVASGVAALILSIEPELTNEEVRHFLTRSAKDLGEPGRDDYYGWGRVDARAALDMVLTCRADLNKDGIVDEQDLSILEQFLGTTEKLADIAPAAKPDGIVDELDRELMMQYWQKEYVEFGLVGRWKLDETEGDIAFDSAGEYNGTLSGAPLWQPESGQIGGALQFDGIDDYISTDTVLNPADGSFSVFAWIKGGVPGQVVLSQVDGSNWLCIDPVEGYLMTELKAAGRGAPGPLLSQTIITDDYWHRIALVWDGSYRHLYVDGIEVAKDAAPSSGLESAEGGLYFGAGSTLAPDTYFSGLIDDIRIYNRVVTP